LTVLYYLAYYNVMFRLLKIVTIYFLILVLFPSNIFAQNYRWPMNIKPRLSSLFGDNRAGHWHSGIDITTRGKQGYKVYAAADGYVYRVRTSFWGYGNALYLKLDDGRYVVYGHLMRFSYDVEKYVRRFQMREKAFYQDIVFKPGQFPVKKGEYIALSGQTGSGAPHLHFEIRDKDNFPVNPLKDIYSFSDSRPPIIDYLVVKRYKSFGAANYHELEFLKLQKLGQDYIVADTVAVYSQTALAVSAYDPNGGFNYGLYGASMLLDDIEIFSFRHDRTDYNTGGQIDYVRDLCLKNIVEKGFGKEADSDKNVFYKLYIQPDDIQGFYGDFKYPAGIIDAVNLKTGVHSLKIKVFDINGGQRQIQLFIKKAAFEKPEIKDTHLDSAKQHLTLGAFPANHHPQVQVRKAVYQHYETIFSYFDKFERIAKFTLSPKAFDYRIRIIDDYSNFSPWLVFRPETDSAKIVPFADYYKVLLPGYFNITDLYNTELEPKLADNRINNGLMPVFNDTGYVELKPEFQQAIDGYYVFNDGGTVYSPDSIIKISLKKDQLYGSTAIRITNPRLDDSGNYIFEILPEDILFKSAVKVQIDADKLSVDSEYASLYYYWQKKDKWVFLGDESVKTISGETMGGGKFAAITDDIPPVIGKVRPRNKGRTNDATPFLSCRIMDNLSGFKKETQFTMTIDGIWVPAYYDIDSHLFSYQVRNPLKSGKHILRISAVDNQGNIAKAISRFIINASK